jgi:predicted transcriptional regulator YdeE
MHKVIGMLKIGEFSKLAQVSVKTLRYYHQYGLLKPAWTDRFNGYRYYRLDQLSTLNSILALKELGFSLEQIQTILQDNLTATQLRGIMSLKKAELEKQISLDQERLTQIEARLHQLEESGDIPHYEIIVKQIGSKDVAGIRKKIGRSEQIYSMYTELCRLVPTDQIQDDPTLPVAAIHYDSEFQQNKSDVEVVVPVSKGTQSDEAFSIYQLPGIEQVACLIHRGPLSSIHIAYQALVSWTQFNRYQIAGPNRDVFLDGFGKNLRTEPDTPIITEVQFPVIRRSFPITISSQKEYPLMEPKIVTKPSFTVVGTKYFGKNENGEIPAMWPMASSRFKEINHTIQPPIWDCYGVCGNLDDQGNFEYLAGIEVTKTKDLPEGMVSWEVPEQTYAVFPCTLSEIHQTYEFAHKSWMPENGYQRAEGPDFEYYDETFEPGDPKSLLYVYIPVEK